MNLWPFRKKEERSTLAQPPKWFVEALSSGPSASGVTVTQATAMDLTAVYAAVDLLARTVGTLPLHTYERLDRGKRKATEHPLYSVLKVRPNPYQTGGEFRSTLQAHLCLWGNAYAEIVLDGRGEVAQLWPLSPAKMKTAQLMPDGRVVYSYELSDGSVKQLPGEIIFHLKALSTDGIMGLSPITQCREALGLALAAQEYGARWFSNGARPSGVLESPGILDEQSYTRLKAQWSSTYQGLTNANRVAILEEGLKYSQIGLPPEDSQFLETRQFQVAEVARIFAVPPHMIGDLTHATFTNIEHQGIDFLQHSIRPWLVRWEERILTSLFRPRDQARFFAEFSADGLLRGDIKSRYEAYSIGRQNGWLSADDIRALENMNPLPDDTGQMYLVPLNMVPAAQVSIADPVAKPPPGAPQSNKGEPQGPGDTARSACSCGHEDREHTHQVETRARIRATDSFEELFREAAARVVRREAEQVRKAAKKHLTTRNNRSFDDWLERFYDQDFPEFIRKQFLPVLTSMGPIVFSAALDEVKGEPGEGYRQDNTDKYADVLALQYAGKSLAQLREVIADNLEDPVPAVEQRLTEWEDKRPAKVAGAEVVRYGNFVAKLAFAAAGVTYLRWDARGSACEICQAMDGVITGIKDAFVQAGADVSGLKVVANVAHPPLHGGCRCVIKAER